MRGKGEAVGTLSELPANRSRSTIPRSLIVRQNERQGGNSAKGACQQNSLMPRNSRAVRDGVAPSSGRLCRTNPSLGPQISSAQPARATNNLLLGKLQDRNNCWSILGIRKRLELNAWRA